VCKGIPTVIVGQRALLREGLTAILQHTAYRIFGTAVTPADVKDMRLPGGQRLLVILGVDGADAGNSEPGETIRLLRSLVPRCTIVVVVETSGPIDVQRAIKFASDGVIVNPGSRDILVKSLELSFMGRQVLMMCQPPFFPAADSAAGSPGSQDYEGASAGNGDSEPQGAPRLSQRERQILTYLARGNSNKTIARLCNLAESTIKVHLKAILRKTDAHNRTQAAVWAITHEGFVGETVEAGPLQPDRPAIGPPSRTNGLLPHTLTPMAQ